ncbi:TIGR01244 family sulfur transferase [Sphingorhabdus sp. 109]|jgi:uncharacterized protein (TIGR01244 family)|uniref:TIGR01244 family sulfur transferase n=1 Tax=Sphingorhabdus sp. 109 TaxID=2653173 RepID=UPI0012EFC898|nr:TIGR01244 family sulfur transferase [Sphingorhabdus sp. 109]VWX58957.1 conserved exported hypothetical protein [Sphingorhabdus sp. 109]
MKRYINLASVILPIVLAGRSAATATANDSNVPTEETQKMFRKINDNLSVSPQISLDDVAAAKAEGVSLIINNRPDGEDPAAPQSTDIEAAARDAGLKYIAIPITHSGFSGPQVDAMIAALADGDKALAYCRSGTRSTLLWALAQAKQGVAPDEIARLAGNAGYDITPVRAMVDALSSGN